MEILVLEHGSESQLGFFGQWAERRGHRLTVLKAHELERWPTPESTEAVVSLGSNSSVCTSPEPWVGEEVAFLKAAHDAGVPVLGICFGAQALAAALGGSVSPGGATLIAWESYESADQELVHAGPWFRWHEDVFSTPPGAVEIARIGATALAFDAGLSIAVQFHPEVDDDLVGKWVAATRARGQALAVDEAQLRAETEAAMDGAQERAFALFDAVERRWTECSGDTFRT